MNLSFHRPTSHILIAGTLCLVFLLGTVLGWANTHLLSADSRFEQFTEELFQKEVSVKDNTLVDTIIRNPAVQDAAVYKNDISDCRCEAFFV